MCNPTGKGTTDHAARIRDPKALRPGTFRSKALKPGLRLILGRLRKVPMRRPKHGTGSRVADPFVVQSVRFNLLHYTSAQDKVWCAKHGLSMLRFEPATASAQTAIRRAAAKAKGRPVKRRKVG